MDTVTEPLDVITVPLISDFVWARLGEQSKRRLRLSCRAARQLVDERVGRVEIDLAARQPEEVLNIAQRTRMRPKRLVLKGLDKKEKELGEQLGTLPTVMLDPRLHALCSRVQELQIISGAFSSNACMVGVLQAHDGALCCACCPGVYAVRGFMTTTPTTATYHNTTPPSSPLLQGLHKHLSSITSITLTGCKIWAGALKPLQLLPLKSLKLVEKCEDKSKEQALLGLRALTQLKELCIDQLGTDAPLHVRGCPAL